VSSPLALAPGSTTKTISGVNGATASSSVTYSFAPTSSSGYYLFTAAFSNFTPGVLEYIGVVTTDLSHNNYVLSEAQTSLTIPITGGQTAASLTLKPVVASIFVAPPAVVPSITGFTNFTNTAGITVGSYETTVFATDELGYVIPTIGSTASDNGASFVLAATTSANLKFAYFVDGSAVAVPLTNTSLTPFLPAYSAAGATGLVTATAFTENGGATAATIGGTELTSVTGSLLTNILTPSAPYSLATNGASNVGLGSPVSTNSAGNAVNINCETASSSVAWQATLTSTNSSTVGGYTYTAANFPVSGTIIPLTAINCTPGFTVPIN
jgi:hypothetical protein